MMKIKCPHCGEITTWEENQFRPFCSKRCKTLDLGAWADEKFKIEDKINQSSSNIELVEQNDD